MVMSIPLTQGKFALVDDSDFQRCSELKWHAWKGRNTYYARSRAGGKTTYMHSFILGCKFVDHRNKNGLDNQRDNLRPCNRAQNNANGTLRKHSSVYRGVRRKAGRFAAEISVNGKVKHLGYFDSESDAALAYNNAAFELFGEFASLNNVLELSQ